ncbi:MFS transporter [Sphingobium lactosutens]|uniref:spinster family MFS transporter n=1 Tax=Sphingobium lactosutens TaxID=522773 RepID=UPI0015BD38AE|nr:MFS transporter [Sphingobium lactosutens]NWK95968.1 MFS transporter [Sphingobium lactosutens]
MNRHFITIMLAVTYAVSFMDRQIFTILQEQIKHEFLLSDAEVGLLQGFSFAIFYGGLAIPVAWLADRHNRINIIATSLALWSLATAACGLAANYTQLMASRIAVAVGESGSLAPAHSMISDLFPSHGRARALGIFSMGTGLGMVCGLAGGGWVGFHYGWRVAFFVFGAPGIILAIALKLTVQEPKRGTVDHGQQAERPKSLFRSIAQVLARPSTRMFILCQALLVLCGYALLSWLPSLMIRSFGVPQTSAGLAVAALALFAHMPGTFLGGHLGDRFVKRHGDLSVLAKLSAVFLALAFPFQIAALWMPSFTPMFLLVGVSMFLMQMSFGPVLSLVQCSVPPGERAITAAVMAFFGNLLGLGLAPVTVGFISDTFAPAWGADSLRVGLSVASAFLVPAALACVAAIHQARAIKTHPADAVESKSSNPALG